jgi:hypothetical protein
VLGEEAILLVLPILMQQKGQHAPCQAETSQQKQRWQILYSGKTAH